MSRIGARFWEAGKKLAVSALAEFRREALGLAEGHRAGLGDRCKVHFGRGYVAFSDGRVAARGSGFAHLWGS